ncbi:hypothetical protein [Idiomarina abyssalis]|uniref:hypothetical protein n=1 Tax=Idiomarina abyssalis TaxID=86102 RepID=UPI003A920968
MDFMNVLQASELVLAVIGLASVVVKLTPTQKDDKILGQVKYFVSRFVALNDPDSAKKPRK